MKLSLPTARTKPSSVAALSPPNHKDFNLHDDVITASGTLTPGSSGFDQCNIPDPQRFLSTNNKKDFDLDTLSGETIGGATTTVDGYVVVDSVPHPPSVPKQPPTKPDQTKMEAFEPPKCLTSATRGHKKCKEAFEMERERAEYAASQANAMSNYVDQYHALLVNTVKETQAFMHNQNNSLVSALNEMAEMKDEHANVTNELSASTKRVHELEAENTMMEIANQDQIMKEKKDVEDKLKIIGEMTVEQANVMKELTASIKRVHELETENTMMKIANQDQIMKEKKDVEELKAIEEELIYHLNKETSKVGERDERLKAAQKELSDTKKKLNEKEKEYVTEKMETMKLTLEVAKLTKECSGDKSDGKCNATNDLEAKKALVDHQTNNLILEQAANANMSQLALQQHQDATSVHWKARINDLAQTVNALKGGNAGAMAGQMGAMLGVNDAGSGGGRQEGSWDPTGMLSMMNRNFISTSTQPSIPTQPQQQRQQHPQNVMMLTKQQLQQLQQQQQLQQMQQMQQQGLQHFSGTNDFAQSGLVNPMNVGNLLNMNSTAQHQHQHQQQQRSLGSSLFSLVYD